MVTRFYKRKYHGDDEDENDIECMVIGVGMVMTWNGNYVGGIVVLAW